MRIDASYGLDQANIGEQKSAEAEGKVVHHFRSGSRDGRKRMCNVVRCQEYEYALPSLLLANKVGADRNRKGGGDEVSRYEQLKYHCTAGVMQGGGAMEALE